MVKEYPTYSPLQKYAATILMLAINMRVYNIWLQLAYN